MKKCFQGMLFASFHFSWYERAKIKKIFCFFIYNRLFSVISPILIDTRT